MNKECQAVGCTNVGIPIKVSMIMQNTNKEEIHDIYMCRFCIEIQEAMEDKN